MGKDFALFDFNVAIGRFARPGLGCLDATAALTNALSDLGISEALVYHALAAEADVIRGNALLLEPIANAARPRRCTASAVRTSRSSCLRGAICILACAAALADPRVVEIDRGHSWVSPYWGYSTPKIVYDGSAYYTAGLWGNTPETSHGVVYRFDGEHWHQGAILQDIYQPATLLLDSAKRLIVFYNIQHKPIVTMRAQQPGQIDAFDTLPPPPGMENAYYIGAAIRDDVVYLAYISIPSYSMFLAHLDLKSQKWSTPVTIAEGQIKTKPKTAWTYPILVPDARGLHLCASNCPDGGEGNTYNIVWYLFFPNGSDTPSVRERVAESQVGYNAYATDMTVEPDGTVHIVHMLNTRKYGDPLPPDAPKEGTYHRRRDPITGEWSRTPLAPICIGGFWNTGKQLDVVTQDGGVLTRRSWDNSAKAWSGPTMFLDPKFALTPPSFMDVISASSGSILPSSIALVTDGLRPQEGDKPQERVVWAILP